MTALRPVRGARDFFPEDSRRRRAIETAARVSAARFGYEEIATPIFEYTEVFARTLGEASDIVSKEMYTFADRGGESLTLRPENTAGVVRAFITNPQMQALPFRVYYQGPMFRYERPQKGRMRQFHQVGVELLGVADPFGDVEVIALAAQFLAEVGVADAVRLELNSLGDPESRAAYRAKLVAYLEARRERLSADSVARLERNPLRVLDSKDEGDRAVVAEAPSLADSLNDASRDFFAAVRDGLGALGIAFEVNPRLVRGLDYYSHTTFEFTTTALGAQGAVLAGGRYDGLVRQMGGPATPGSGWAAGVERLMLLAGEPPAAAAPVAVLPLGAEQMAAAMVIAARLRATGVAATVGFAGGAGKQMKWANRIGAAWAILLGSDEAARGVAAVRDMATGAQEDVALDAIEARLAPPA